MKRVALILILFTSLSCGEGGSVDSSAPNLRVIPNDITLGQGVYSIDIQPSLESCAAIYDRDEDGLPETLLAWTMAENGRSWGERTDVACEATREDTVLRVHCTKGDRVLLTVACGLNQGVPINCGWSRYWGGGLYPEGKKVWQEFLHPVCFNPLIVVKVH